MIMFCSRKYSWLTKPLALILVVGCLYWSVAINLRLLSKHNGQRFESYLKWRIYLSNDRALQQRQLENETTMDFTNFSRSNKTSESDEETDLISMMPIKFLPNFKNPCWYDSTGSENASETKPRLRCLPYFFIAGFAKCATTDLFARLILHPEIVRSVKKETHWWSRHRFDKGRGSIQEYANLQSLATEEIERVQGGYNRVITVDGSASTAWYNFNWRQIPQNDVTADEPRYLNVHSLKHVLPKAKFIFIMREPGRRLYSEYLFLKRLYGSDVTPKDFHRRVMQSIEVFKNCSRYRTERSCVFDSSVADAMEIRIYPGLYAVYLGDWIQIYSRKQLFFLRTEDYGRKMAITLKNLFNFLDVESLDNTWIEKIASGSHRNQRLKRTTNVGPMWQETRTILNDFYAPYNDRLVKMLKHYKYLWHDVLRDV